MMHAVLATPGGSWRFLALLEAESMHIYVMSAPVKAESMCIYVMSALLEAESMHIYVKFLVRVTLG